MISMLSSVIVVAKLLKKDKKQVDSVKKDASRVVYKQKRKPTEKLPFVEVSSGVEPLYTVLQTVT